MMDAHGAEASRFLVHVEWRNERTHVVHVNVCLSLKQALNHKKTVPWRGFYSSSGGPTGAPCLLSLWFNYCSLRSARQPFCLLSNCSHKWRNKERGSGWAGGWGGGVRGISLVQVQEPPRRHCSFREGRGRWQSCG